MRVVSLAHDAPTGPHLHSYEILPKNTSKGIDVMERKRMRLRTDAVLIAISPERIGPPEPFGRGIKKINK